MDNLANPEAWSQAGGILGLIIMALFVFAAFQIKEHRAERREWRKDSKDSSDKMTAALEKLTDTIRDRRD